MKKILPIGIFFLSVVIIFFGFPHIPLHLAFDEIEFAKIALSLDKTGYIAYTAQANGHSTLYFYILLISIKIFGLTTFALRFPSALFGVGSVVVFYLIVKKVFKNDITAFIAAFILVTSRWFFNFARFAFEPTFLLFLELCSIYCLLKYLEKKNKKDTVLSGIFAGLAFHSYLPGRIFFLLPLTMFWKNARKTVPVFLVTTLLVMLPLLTYLMNHPDTRVQQTVFVLDEKISLSKKLALVGENVRKTSLMFYTQGDLNGRHNFPGKPALNPIIVLLATAGFLRALYQHKNIHNQLFIGYFLLSLAPLLITDPADNPSMIRSFTALASLAYFCGVAASWLAGRVKKPRRLLVYSLLGTLLLVSAALELRTYYVFQTKVQRNAFEVTCDLQSMVQLQPKTLKEVPLNCQVTEDLFNQ